MDRAMSTTIMPPGTSDYVDQIKKHLDYVELNRTPLALAVNEIWRHLEFLTDELIEGVKFVSNGNAISFAEFPEPSQSSSS
jgi:hypothetical protein